MDSTDIRPLFRGLLHGKGLAVNASSLGTDQLFATTVNSQARLLAFIGVFWALQILGFAGAALVCIRRRALNASVPTAEHARAVI
jgi:hypothetical protein